ncbi:MAG: c-type cytochrome [Gammaproteobacteria bacterium]|nr:c-type cytochrome [Gammaproteobacteria bacterium]MBU1977811.1 c-type cytochrome [Gammaproteobacteria bacterium]
MKKLFFLAAALILVQTVPVLADVPQQPKAPGVESKGYVWNEPAGEKAEILKLKGDAERGRIAYRVCQGCHKSDGAGLRDGTYPQLAGQHATVLIKQMADVRDGRRENPKMFPFAGKHIIDMQEIADVAVYLQNMKIPHDNGKGPGTSLARGKELYKSDCHDCHGENGEGNEKKFYPVLAGQHYKYMLRQIMNIRDGKRGNANLKMVKVVQNYSDADMEAVVDYMSRLSMPERSAVRK